MIQKLKRQWNISKKKASKSQDKFPLRYRNTTKKYRRPLITLSDEDNENCILMKLKSARMDEVIARKNEEIARLDEVIARLDAELAKLKGSR